MAIKVYILKKAIMKSSVDEYLALKAEAKEKKKLEKQMNPENAIEQKQKKDLRAVFVSTSDTALQALEIAGVSYEGDIDLEDIEFCKVESQQKCICGNLHIPKLNAVIGEKMRMYFFANRKNIVIIDDEEFAVKVIKRIIASRTRPGESRERFLYNFCIKFMDQDLDNLGRYEKRIMNLEERVTGGELEGVTSEIAILRKELLILREYYDELHDFGKQRADRLRGRTMYLLDYIGQVRDTYQGKVAEHQNANMEFLTIISTIFFPLTLITGWYGMNFENMPELTHGYPFVIGLSLVVVAIIIFIFKKRKIL